MGGTLIFYVLVVKTMADDSGEMDELNRILKPLLQQTERSRRHLQRGGTIPDVDPETGQRVSRRVRRSP